MRIEGLSFQEEGLPWRATRVEGVSWLPLWQEEGAQGRAGGRARGGAAVLIRMAAGCGYAPHRHIGTEDVLVLQGGYEDQFGVHRAGEFVHYAAGTEHAPRALGDPRATGRDSLACVLYAIVPQGIELLER